MFYTHQTVTGHSTSPSTTPLMPTTARFCALGGTDAAGFSVPAAAPEDGHAMGVKDARKSPTDFLSPQKTCSTTPYEV